MIPIIKKRENVLFLLFKSVIYEADQNKQYEQVEEEPYHNPGQRMIQ